MEKEGETIRLKKRLHWASMEIQRMQHQQMVQAQDMARAQQEVDTLRIKCENLEHSDRQKGLDLMEERSKNDELSKQLLEMCENLLTLTGKETNGQKGGEKGKENKAVMGMRK